MEVLQVVQQLRDLAADPQNRSTIARDQGCLPGLVVFLDNSNYEVVYTALEALHFLSQVPTNRPLMRNEVGLIISLRNIIRRSERDPKLIDLAQRIHDLLIPPAGAAARPFSLARTPSRGGGNVFLASNRKARMITIQVSGLRDQRSREVVEDQLLMVKGVISFTVDMARQRCTVRLRSDVKPDTVCCAITSSGMLTAQQVVKNEHGEEVLLSFGPSPEAHVHEKENSHPVKLPDYLPEEHDDSPTEDKAVERAGAVDGEGGWFSSMTGFIGKAFYW